MAHITIMSGSASMANKHLRPDYLQKRDSNSASCQNIDRMGIDGQNRNGDTENGDNQNTNQTCLQKYKTWAYFGCIGLVIVLTVVLIVLAATGAFDSTGS